MCHFGKVFCFVFMFSIIGCVSVNGDHSGNQPDLLTVSVLGETGQPCERGSDCASGVCTNESCIAATCSDGFKNQAETDVDCGGPKCPGTCGSGKACGVEKDCEKGMKCMTEGTGKFCRVPACENMMKDGKETDVDCGGECAPCVDGKVCAGAKDCTSGVCMNNQCKAARCDDGVKNGKETDVDCGGESCPGCVLTKQCLMSSDCASGFCQGGKCAPKACENKVKDPDEADVDCGGPCAPCANGYCLRQSDCPKGNDCLNNRCTPVGMPAQDLGQPANLPDLIVISPDASSLPDQSVVRDAFVAPDQLVIAPADLGASPDLNCPINFRNCNGNCTDVGSNNAHCGACSNPCLNGTICVDKVCIAIQDGIIPSDLGAPQSDLAQGQDGMMPPAPDLGQPPAARCDDVVKNGQETDVDCGGGTCVRCAIGKACLGAADCVSATCANNVCIAAPNPGAMRYEFRVTDPFWDAVEPYRLRDQWWTPVVCLQNGLTMAERITRNGQTWYRCEVAAPLTPFVGSFFSRAHPEWGDQGNLGTVGNSPAACTPTSGVEWTLFDIVNSRMIYEGTAARLPCVTVGGQSRHALP